MNRIILLLLPLLLAACAPRAHTDYPIPAPTRVYVQEAVHELAARIATRDWDEADQLYPVLEAHLHKHPVIYASAFAFAPKRVVDHWERTAPYVYRAGAGFIRKNLAESYDYSAPEAPWYVMPVKLKTGFWTEPYFDKGGGEAWMVTYSLPIYRDQRLLGVITSDLLVDTPFVAGEPR